MGLSAAQKAANVATIKAGNAARAAAAPAPAQVSSKPKYVAPNPKGLPLNSSGVPIQPGAQAYIAAKKAGVEYVPPQNNKQEAVNSQMPDVQVPDVKLSDITGITEEGVNSAGKGLIQAEDVAKKYGIPGVDSTISAAIKTKLAEQQRQKEYLASVTQKSNALDQSKVDQAIKGIGTQESAATAKFAQGREGPMSGTRTQLVDDIHSELSTQKDQILKQQELTLLERDNAQKELAYAQQQNNQQLAEYWGAKFQAAQDRLDQLDIMKDQMAQGWAKIAIQQQEQQINSFKAFTGFVDQGVAFDPSQLPAMATMLNLPASAVGAMLQYQQGAKNIIADKALDPQIKKQQLENLKATYKNLLVTPEQRNVNNYIDFLSSNAAASMTEDQKIGVAKAFGVDIPKDAVTSSTSTGPTGTASSFENWMSGFATAAPTQDFNTDITDGGKKKSYFADGRKIHGAIDIPGKLNSPVVSPVSGKVTETSSAKDSGWGNSVVIQDSQGNKWRLAHFNSLNFKKGDAINVGDTLGLLGNTGHVIKSEKGTGAHVHLEVHNTDGKLVDPKTMFTGTQQSSGAVSDAVNAIMAPFSTAKPTSYPANIRGAIENELTKKKQEAAATGDILGYIKASAGGNAPTESERTALKQAMTSRDQLSEIEKNISEMSTGPFIGKLRKLNVYDDKAKLVIAQLQGITPNIARGIYGERGVLTDQDVKNYIQTLPNLTNTEDQNKLLIAMTAKIIQKSMLNELEASARSGIDVSGWASYVEDLQKKEKDLVGSISQPISAPSSKQKTGTEEALTFFKNFFGSKLPTIPSGGKSTKPPLSSFIK